MGKWSQTVVTKWTLDLDGTSHTVELEQDYSSGKQSLRVDEAAVEEQSGFWRDLLQLRWKMSGTHACVAHVREHWWGGNLHAPGGWA
jgi:hypothetical protein